MMSTTTMKMLILTNVQDNDGDPNNKRATTTMIMIQTRGTTMRMILITAMRMMLITRMMMILIMKRMRMMLVTRMRKILIITMMRMMMRIGRGNLHIETGFEPLPPNEVVSCNPAPP